MKITRWMTCVCLVPLGLTLGVGTSGAAPANSPNSELITAHCGADGHLSLLISGGGGAPAFEVGSNGRVYELRTISGRVYADLAGSTEPVPTSPDFTFSQDYGKRLGFPRTLTCTASNVQTWGGVVYTTFFDAVLAAK